MEHNVKLEIATSKGVFEGEFAKTTKITEVIATVVEAMQLVAGDLFDLVLNGTVLQPKERPLVSFGIKEFAQLELVATGSGV